MRGQAAFEFLTSYGLLFLMLVSGIALLAYMGVVNFDTFNPNSCVIEPEFSCQEWKVSSDGNIYLSIKNNFGRLSEVNVTFSTQDCALINNSYFETSIDFNEQLNKENNGIITFSCDKLLTEGEPFEGSMTLTYLRHGKAIVHTVNGKLVQRVE